MTGRRAQRGRRACLLLGSLLALVAAVPAWAPAAGAATRSAGAHVPAAHAADAGEQAIAPGLPFTPGALLSDEQRLTRWAYARTTAVVHGAAFLPSTPVGRLRFRTEDGLPEVYMVLRGAVDKLGNQWVEVQLPMRPNGRVGWVQRAALGDFRIVRTQLVIDRAKARAVLYKAGRAIWRSPVGTGKPSTPTPAGRFYIREHFRVKTANTIYGPYAFGTSAYSVLSDWPRGGIVGIHGTDQPQLIPGHPSHGCVRVPNAAILRLARLMPIGTPVRIV